MNKIVEFKPKNVKLINRYSEVLLDIDNYETIKLQHQKNNSGTNNGRNKSGWDFSFKIFNRNVD
jgi:hypothetical protein